MKVISLLTISLMNLIQWYSNDFSFGFYNNTLPLVSVILSLLFSFPKIGNKYISISLLHFIIAGILFFNIPLYLKSLISPSDIYIDLSKLNISEKFFIKSNLLLGVSLPLIVGGYSLSFNKKNNSNQLWRKRQPFPPLFLKLIFFLSIVFLILSFSVTGLKIGATYIGASSYNYILLNRFLLLGTCLFIYNYEVCKVKNKTLFRQWTILCIIYSLYVLVGGDRGPILTLILIFIFGYLLRVNMKLSFPILFAGLLVSFIVYVGLSFVEILRLSTNSELNYSTLSNSFNQFGENEDVFGSMIRCTSLAIEGIENNYYPHTYGLFLLQNLLKGIPFLGNQLLSIIPIPDILSNGSAHLVTIQYYGFNYASGLGTTFLADTYIEFGIIGIIAISILFGAFIRNMNDRCLNKEFGFIGFLLIAFFTGYSIYTGRSVLWSFLVNFTHTYLMFLLIKFVYKMVLRIKN